MCFKYNMNTVMFASVLCRKLMNFKTRRGYLQSANKEAQYNETERGDASQQISFLETESHRLTYARPFIYSYFTCFLTAFEQSCLENKTKQKYQD